MTQQSSVGAVSGVGQIDVLSNLLQQAQQLQSLQNQLAGNTAAVEPEPQPVFNTVSHTMYSSQGNWCWLTTATPNPYM